MTSPLHLATFDEALVAGSWWTDGGTTPVRVVSPPTGTPRQVEVEYRDGARFSMTVATMARSFKPMAAEQLAPSISLARATHAYLVLVAELLRDRDPEFQLLGRALRALPRLSPEGSTMLCGALLVVMASGPGDRRKAAASVASILISLADVPPLPSPRSGHVDPDRTGERAGPTPP